MYVPDNDTVSCPCENLSGLSRWKYILKRQIMSVNNMNLLMNAIKVPNSDGLNKEYMLPNANWLTPNSSLISHLGSKLIESFHTLSTELVTMQLDPFSASATILLIRPKWAWKECMSSQEAVDQM